MPPRLLLACSALLTVAVLAACGAETAMPLDRAVEATPLDEPAPAGAPRAGADDLVEEQAAAEAPTTTTTTTTTEAPPVDVHALVPPAAAGDPEGLARQIAEAETVIRDPESSPAAVAEAALLQQVAYRKLGATPEWDDAVLATLPAELHFAAATNAAARREFRNMHTKLGENVPAWEIIRPAPAEQLLAWYQEAEAEFGVPWNILAAVNLVETGMGRIRGLSVAGARGPMQFMPATWDAYGEGDIDDPHDAIRGAARYLAANGGGRGDIDNALFHYNRDNRYVRGVKHYAALIGEHPTAFLAYYHWGIWYLTVHGDIFLPVGYHEPESVPAAEYLARG